MAFSLRVGFCSGLDVSLTSRASGREKEGRRASQGGPLHSAEWGLPGPTSRPGASWQWLRPGPGTALGTARGPSGCVANTHLCDGRPPPPTEGATGPSTGDKGAGSTFPEAAQTLDLGVLSPTGEAGAGVGDRAGGLLQELKQVTPKHCAVAHLLGKEGSMMCLLHRVTVQINPEGMGEVPSTEEGSINSVPPTPQIGPGTKTGTGQLGLPMALWFSPRWLHDAAHPINNVH